MLVLKDLITALDFAGVAVFAATGALAAARIRGDIITFIFFGAFTGIGGGTFRDLLLGVPVFWINNEWYLVTCIAVALLVWFAGGPRRVREQALLWLDAVGLAGFAILGASKAVALGAAPLIAVLMGTMTACFGGIIRDVMANQPSVLIKREIYVSAALVGATLYTVLVTAGLAPRYAMLMAFVAAFLLRGGALRYGWHLPAFPDSLAPPRLRSRAEDEGEKPGD